MKIDKKETKSEDRTICVVCAWRMDCKKKYSFQTGGSTRCPDYTRDMTIPQDEENGC